MHGAAVRTGGTTPCRGEGEVARGGRIGVARLPGHIALLLACAGLGVACQEPKELDLREEEPPCAADEVCRGSCGDRDPDCSENAGAENSGGIEGGGPAQGGDSGASPTGSGGTGGTPPVGPGTGGELPVPATVPAKGASRITPLGSSCGTGPYGLPVGGAPTSEWTMGDLVVDGSNGDTVQCRVAPVEGGYAVSAQIRSGPSAFEVSVDLAVAQTTVDQFVGTGRVGFSDPGAGTVTSSSCTIAVTAAQTIAPGVIWARINCPDSLDDAGQSRCAFNGTFAFDACAKE